MATNVLMPKLGLTMTEGTVVKWNKAVGDNVTAGEALVEIETDKINNVIESPASGTLLKVFVSEGDTMEVTGLIAVIGEPGEKIEDIPSAVEAEENQPTQEKTVTQESVENNDSLADLDKDRIIASPAAKKLAREMNIDISLVNGSGPNGRIIEKDILSFKEDVPKASPLAVKVAAEKGIDLGDIKKNSRIMKSDVLAVSESQISQPETSSGTALSGMRKVIAERMTDSWQNTPHVNLTYEVDMTEAQALKDKMTTSSGVKYSFTEIIVKAVSHALTEHKEINSSLINGQIYQHDSVHMGIAVALDDGLIVPVIRDAQKKSINVLKNEIKQLGEKARTGQLLPDEISGGTFTVSNLGMYGVDEFTPIINPPQSAILGVCRMVKKPVVVEDEIKIRPMMNLCLSIDHRLIDGAVAARFMKDLRNLLQQPYQML